MILLIFSIIIFSAYCLLIASFFVGWKRTKIYLNSHKQDIGETKISVVVACKNEENVLPKLLKNLKNQRCNDFELILIDDNSTDRTFFVMQENSPDFQQIKILKSNGKGKKAALREGILAANGNLIVTTDADCQMSETWLETILHFQNNNDCDLIICPVAMCSASQIKILEFTSLVLSGAGAAGIGQPILCNGANLAFKKQVWLENKAHLHFEQQSGDDIFLLESVKRRKGKICFLKSHKAMVYTAENQNFATFFRQRRRWTEKSIAYTDKFLIFTALTVFSTSLLEIILFVAVLFNFFYIFLFFAVFILKFFIDTAFLLAAKRFFRLKNVVFNAFLLSICYPFYVCVTVFSAFFKQSKTWK